MNKKSFNILLVTTFIFFLMIAFAAPFCEASGKASAEISTAEHQGTANEKHGSEGGGHHGAPYAEVFKIFAIILICAIIGRFGAKKLKQSAVLGELVIGLSSAQFYTRWVHRLSPLFVTMILCRPLPIR